MKKIASFQMKFDYFDDDDVDDVDDVVMVGVVLVE